MTSNSPAQISSPTLLSTVQKFTTHDALPTHPVHPFSASSEQPRTLLQDLLNSTDQLANSLNVHFSAPLTDPKLVSLFRQHTTIAHTLHLSEQTARQTASSLLARRPSAVYGEDIPPDRALLPEWCAARLEAWGTAAGMEIFREADREQGRMSVVFGGKVIVVDLDLDIAPEKVEITRLKTSFASANTNGAPALDDVLARGIRAFLDEVQKDEDKRDAVEAERLGKKVVAQLKYLMVLDALAARPEAEGGGVRWFVGVDELARGIEDRAGQEAKVVANSLTLPHAPLDILLYRSHALPLPYLTSPALSFLVLLSPLAYLTLRSVPIPSPSSTPSTSPIATDIPLAHLRAVLSTHPPGATLATLVLTPTPTPSHHVPPIQDTDQLLPSIPDHAWVLDFTGSGRGVVMSQGRMRAIERVLRINEMDGALEGMGMGAMMGFGTGSWVDLLLNPGPENHQVSPERYTTLYRSPTDAHPPLQLRLTAPEEPGFILERVQVRSKREIDGVFEVVRQQCWLNEVLNGGRWAPEGLTTHEIIDSAGDVVEEGGDGGEATESELAAVLAGTLQPRRLPVNVYLPLSSSPSASHQIVMTAPERAPISGLVEIGVAHDPSRACGVRVEVHGGFMGMSMGVGGDVDVVAERVLEEAGRRGGVLGLAGRVWAGAGTQGGG